MQGGQPCGFYPRKVEIRGNGKRLWKCGKSGEISLKWPKFNILIGKERQFDKSTYIHISWVHEGLRERCSPQIIEQSTKFAASKDMFK